MTSEPQSVRGAGVCASEEAPRSNKRSLSGFRNSISRVTSIIPAGGDTRAPQRLVCVLLILVAIVTPLRAEDTSASGLEFFEKKIRPLLSENCYKCHSAQSEKLKGGLRLDARDNLLKGGDSGPAIVPNDPDKSLLIKAVRYTDPDLQMPPKNRKLSDRQISDLVAWIKMGAPWPAEAKGTPAKATFEVTEKDRSWWAFQPIKRPLLPALKSRARTRNPIDRLLLASLEAKGIQRNPPATRRELIRRAFFDLIGLPPTPDEVKAFEADNSANAFEQLIDNLLARPQYGERWGRHWLDVVRFAQSNGYERDGEKPMAWRYRDYVIRSFNADKPYDLFVKEQLAGDELANASAESIVATGFQRLGVWDDEPDDKQMAVYDELDDIVSTTGQAFLGLTLGCARCHDHKFDPISQTDYYQFLSFFRNVRPYENAKFNLDSANYVPFAEPGKVKAWQLQHEQAITNLEKQAEVAKDEAEKKKLRGEIKKAREEAGPFEWALAVRESSPNPLPTHVLIRGNPRSEGPPVEPAFLTVLGGTRPHFSTSPSHSTGRRSALADWIANPANPLTARVMVNRIWQHHFGKGLVKTTTDFGRAGSLPTHPALLDWLAAEFIDSGWSVKKLHKTIMLSAAWQMSSRSENSAALEKDPANDLWWRQSLRRLEAETIRDSILAISGDLNPQMGGRGFFPHLAGEVLAGASRPGLDWQRNDTAAQSRRSVYTYIRRTLQVPALEAFDYNNTSSPLGERPVTTVAPQALMLLNDDFMQQRSAGLASTLLRSGKGNLESAIRAGFLRTVSREPTSREIKIARDYVRRQASAFSAIRDRQIFRPDVPTSLSVEYMNQLRPENFLLGPTEGWSHYRGNWAPAYEGIRTVDRHRGPFALWETHLFENGTVTATLVFDRGSDFGSVLLRASASGDEQRGYEICFDPRQQKILLRRHGTNINTLCEIEAAIPVARPFPVKFEIHHSRVRVWTGAAEEPLLDFVDPKPLLEAGYLGVRTWGAPLSIDHLQVVSSDEHLRSEPAVADRPQTSEQHLQELALQSFCLLLLNLNEMIYVD